LQLSPALVIFNHARYLDMSSDDDTALSNLFVRLLQDAGIDKDSFGQSTSTLSWD
jgi:hypothetical protein